MTCFIFNPYLIHSGKNRGNLLRLFGKSKTVLLLCYNKKVFYANAANFVSFGDESLESSNICDKRFKIYVRCSLQMYTTHNDGDVEY